MGYVSRRGRRPNEYASKSAHSHVIKDPSVQALLRQCDFPKRAGEISLPHDKILPFKPETENPIKYIIAIDGGFNEVPVQIEFPSSTVCFFQIGALIFSVDDLEALDEKPFIDPDDMAKLKQMQHLKFTLPIKNLTLKTEGNLIDSVRQAIYRFFLEKIDNDSLMDTLRWLIFQEYGVGTPIWNLASCPVCEKLSISLHRGQMTTEFKFHCNHCGGEILLTDVFRLHEAVDNEIGAGGILSYLTTTIEQIVIVHLIRLILKLKPSLLRHVMFIQDGPLAFFGQTANMHKPMRALVRFLFENQTLYLAGLVKSGAFVEHADEIRESLKDGTILILDNHYIYRYIVPGKADPDTPYGRTTYYSNKVIFKTSSGAIYVVCVPTTEIIPAPKESDLPNLQLILTNVEKLKCDMYDNSLLPVALANRLVSLANHPSSRILQRFAKNAVSH